MKRVIVGAQWGDEGKGKVVNYFAAEADWVLRYAGGANAGHTVYCEGKKYVHHLLPSVRPNDGSKAYLGAGMVIDLPQMINELDALEADFPGISGRFILDPEAFLVLPWHKEEDFLLEELRREKIGTTGRGIGPAYSDKTARQGLKILDLLDAEGLRDRLDAIYVLKKALYGDKLTTSFDEVYQGLLDAMQELLRRGVTVRAVESLRSEWDQANLLFEGAQGVLLDPEIGTYPFVTSGACTAFGCSVLGYSPAQMDEVLGISKAYCTRVGEGPFPSEIFGPQADDLRTRGAEFGATTGRPRRVGWLDLPALRYAAKKSALTGIVLTKADCLNGIPEIPFVVAYELNGQRVDYPLTGDDFRHAKPIYDKMPGWKDISDPAFHNYAARLEQELGLPIAYLSTGPKTEEFEPYHHA